MTPKRKPSPGYGHELIRLEQPRDELCQDVAHIMRRAMIFNGGRPKPIRPDERISHICQWRYKRRGAEAIVRRWVCRGCAIAWARKHIWTKTKLSRKGQNDGHRIRA